MAPGGGRASSSPRPVLSPRAVPSPTACQDRSGGSSSTTARSATKVPRPGRGTTRPSWASRAIARWTVTGEARWRAISSRRERQRAAGGEGGGAVARHQLANGRQAAARGEGTGSRPHILDNTLVCVIVDHEQWE